VRDVSTISRIRLILADQRIHRGAVQSLAFLEIGTDLIDCLHKFCKEYIREDSSGGDLGAGSMTLGDGFRPHPHSRGLDWTCPQFRARPETLWVTGGRSPEIGRGNGGTCGTKNQVPMFQLDNVQAVVPDVTRNPVSSTEDEIAEVNRGTEQVYEKRDQDRFQARPGRRKKTEPCRWSVRPAAGTAWGLRDERSKLAGYFLQNFLLGSSGQHQHNTLIALASFSSFALFVGGGGCLLQSWLIEQYGDCPR
jgi:hypothetical protein